MLFDNFYNAIFIFIGFSSSNYLKYNLAFMIVADLYNIFS